METWQFLPCAFEFMLRFLFGLYAGVMTDQFWYPIARCMRGSLMVVPYRTKGMRGSFWSGLVPYRSPDFCTYILIGMY